MIQLDPHSPILKAGRRVGLVLLALHSVLALVALSSFSNGWWATMFFIDMPASWPGYLLMDHVKGDFIPWLVFTLLGSIWQFFWPQAIAILGECFIQWLKKYKRKQHAA